MVYFGSLAILSVAFVLLVITFIFFKYLFDPLFGKVQRSITRDWTSKSPVFKVDHKEKGFRPEIERFIHEEYESSNHDVVAVVISTAKKCVGVAVFCQDRQIQYFHEKEIYPRKG